MNPDLDEGMGGHFVPHRRKERDVLRTAADLEPLEPVAPKGDRLIIFEADALAHGVEAYRDAAYWRYALTVWILAADDVLDLDAAETCDAVRKLARHVLGDASARRCSVLAVVSAAPAQPSFVRTPSDRSDGVTAFASGAALARERGLLAPTSGAANAWLGGRGAKKLVANACR